MWEVRGRGFAIYIVVDCSGGMCGSRIEAVRDGMNALLHELRTDPLMIEIAYISVIAFGTCANRVCPLTDLIDFAVPPLAAGGAASLGAGLRLLEDCVAKEVRRPTDFRRGIFILS